MNQENVDPDNSLSPIIHKPLSKRKLKHLFELIRKSVEELPDKEPVDEYFDDS